LPTVNTIIASNNNILQKEDIVNKYYAQKSENDSENVEKSSIPGTRVSDIEERFNREWSFFRELGRNGSSIDAFINDDNFKFLDEKAKRAAYAEGQRLAKAEKSGSPILVAIRPDGKGHYNNVETISNFILSTYGKNEPMAFLNALAKKSDKVLYINEFRINKLLEQIFDKNKRTKEEFKGARLQLPARLNNLWFNYILHKSENVVKNNFNENTVKLRLEALILRLHTKNIQMDLPNVDLTIEKLILWI